MSQIPAVVDDRDSSIVYSDGWQQVTSSAEFRFTKTGASNTGQTASFTFTGTSVEVYGAQGSYDVYGVPVSTYSIDGSVVATHTAPIIEPGSYTSQTLFFKSDTLSASQHELVITNINGTNPSIFWLDYIRFTPATQVQVTPTNSDLTQGSSTRSATSTDDVTSSALESSPTASATASTSSSSRKTNVGPIVGGVLGGVVLLLALMFIIFRCLRSRHSSPDIYPDGNITPFGSWRNIMPRMREKSTPELIVTSSYADLGTIPALSGGAGNHTPSVPPSPPSPPELPHTTGKRSRRANQRPIPAIPAPVPVLRDHEDSGLRIASSAVTDVPPAYTQA